MTDITMCPLSFLSEIMADTYNFTVPTTAAPPTLAVPTFITKAQDTLVASDVYKATGKTLNSFQDVVKDIKSVLPTLLQGGRALAQFIPILQSIKNGNINIASLVSRLTTASSGVLGLAIKGLDPSTQAAILSTTSTLGKYAVQIGTVTQQIKSTNFSSIASIGSSITALSGDAKAFGITDPGNLASTIGGIVRSSGQYGLSGIYGTLTKGINDADQLFQAGIKAYPGIAANTDIASLKQYGASVGYGLSATISPNVVADVTSQFTRTTALDQNPSPSNDSSIFPSVLSAFNTVKQGWNTAVKATTEVTSEFGLSNVFDVSHMVGNANDDFRSMVGNGVMSMPDDSKEYVLASLYPATDVTSQLQGQFPKTLFTAV